ncbi:MAG: EAL domain-containing protein, partial [Litorivicinus sp.]
VGVARQLGLRAVAEGVESASQLALLSDIGFDGFQGFLLSPPVGAEALQGQLNQSERTRLELIQALRSA